MRIPQARRTPGSALPLVLACWVAVQSAGCSEDESPADEVPFVRAGGLIAVDNTLWSGRLIDPDPSDEDSVALKRFNETLHRDERVDLVGDAH